MRRPHLSRRASSRSPAPVSYTHLFGDLDQGVDNFEGPAHPDSPGCQYEEMTQTRVKLKDYVEPYTENDIHHLADVGNEPKLMYLMREGRKWRE